MRARQIIEAVVEAKLSRWKVTVDVLWYSSPEGMATTTASKDYTVSASNKNDAMSKAEDAAMNDGSFNLGTPDGADADGCPIINLSDEKDFKRDLKDRLRELGGG